MLNKVFYAVNYYLTFKLSNSFLNLILEFACIHVVQKTVKILISWLLKKPADLDLHRVFLNNVSGSLFTKFSICFLHSKG